MQDLRIYILIEDPKTKHDVSIKGNLEVLRAFLSGVGTLEIKTESDPITNLPVEEPKQFVTI